MRGSRSTRCNGHHGRSRLGGARDATAHLGLDLLSAPASAAGCRLGDRWCALPSRFRSLDRRPTPHRHHRLDDAEAHGHRNHEDVSGGSAHVTTVTKLPPLVFSRFPSRTNSRKPPRRGRANVMIDAGGAAAGGASDVSVSAHQRTGLGEGPVVALRIGGFVGAETLLLDVLDDLGAVRLGVCEVGVEVVDVDERRVSRRSARV